MTEKSEHTIPGKEGITSPIPLLRYVALAFAAWTLCIAASLVWNVRDVRKDTRSLAIREARLNFNKDQAFRLWATSHGGVYVPVDSRTPPNPNLNHVPERDITTPSGKALTLMNPAYMVRQLMDDYSEQYGIRGRITSLNPLWEGNAPDEWERRALRSFDEGAEEAFEFTDIDGKPYLRLMRPMVAQTGCLKCHGFQGYREGDVRGGVGVSVPLAPLLKIESEDLKTLYLSHGLIWLLGLVGIRLGSQRVRRDITEQQSAEESLRQKEEQLNRIVHNVPVVLWSVDREGIFTLSEGKGLDALGLKPGEVVGLSVYDVYKDVPEIAEQVRRVLSGEAFFTTVQVGELYFDTHYEPLRDSAGNVMGVIGISTDITQRQHSRKLTERQLDDLRALRTIDIAITTSLDLQHTLNVFLEQIRTRMNVDAADVLLLNRHSRVLEYAAGSGFRTRAIKKTAVRMGDGYAGMAALERRPFIITDISNPEEEVKPIPLMTEEGFSAYCGIPLIAKDDVKGVLEIYYRSPFTPDMEWVERMEVLSGQAAIAVDNAKLFGDLQHSRDDLEKQVEYLRSLRTIDIMITGSLDLRHILNVILEQVVSRLGVDAADVLLLNEHTKVLEYAAGSGFHTRAVTQTALRLGDGFAGRAALERRPLMVPDLSQPEEDVEPAALMAEEGFKAYFGVPLIAKGDIKGVLEIYYRSPFTPDMEWVERMEALSGQAAIAVDNAKLFGDLQRSRDELVLAYDSTIEGWANALDLRDKETEGHSRRVTEMTVRVAREMGMREEELVHVRRGALLHDIGKMTVPDSVLFKDGPLTDEEQELMHHHPEYSFKLLYPIRYLRPALDIPYSHHERWDGTGYPRGLKGEQIPLAARIFAVVDNWDALLQARRYHEAWPVERVHEHIRSLAGTHFDPRVVEVFLGMQWTEGG